MDRGHQKAAAKLGVEVGEIELLLRSLATRIRDEKQRCNEIVEDYASTKPNGRFAMEIDYLKNVTVRDSQTGKKVFLRGTEAMALQNRLRGSEDQQAILATYVGQMTESDDASHRGALEKTGFWGKAGAGCIVMARDTGPS